MFDPLRLEEPLERVGERERPAFVVLRRLRVQADDASFEVHVAPLELQDLAWDAPPGDVVELDGWTNRGRQVSKNAPDLLIRISSPNNLKTSYLDTLGGLTKKFKTDLLLPLQTAPRPVKEASIFDELFARLGETDIDDAYLKEAVDCARAGLIRAAAVMGWCAAVARIHRTVEKIGFQKFDVASATMASQTQAGSRSSIRHKA